MRFWLHSQLTPERERQLPEKRQRGEAALAVMERHLAQRLYFVSERYSIADIHLFRLYWRMFNSLRPEAGEFPALDAHYIRMMARPAVQKTIKVEAAVGYELPA